MDPRVRKHAEIIADHSTRIEGGDNVIVNAPPVAEDLVTALFAICGERGANPQWLGQTTAAHRAFMNAADADQFETPEHALAQMEAADVYVSIRGDTNTRGTSDIDPEKTAAYSKAHRPVFEERMGKRWVGTQYPASGNAQEAEMATEAYENFVYAAIDKDWDQQREHQAQMVEILDPADEVRIVSGDTTDVTMSVAGNPTANDYAELNLPGGEVYTAPVPESVEGEVLFDMPVINQGREMQGVRLVFEDGEVVEHAAEKNEAVLTSLLDTDGGARRLGELGIGMNRDIDRFSYNMLFDEKMGDTVHMAIGRSIPWTVGEDNEANDSATHVDMIVDMSEDSFIEVDGEVVQRNGTFVFEDGFEA
jgi:aminopeptidase